MTASKKMKSSDTHEMQRLSEPDVYLQPAVDIYEEDSSITLQADLPGVSRDRLDVQVDGNALVIEGQAKLDMPEDMEALYADISTTRFRRQFTLSNGLETEQISAEIKDGVLTLHLPKRAELQPRKITVNAS